MRTLAFGYRHLGDTLFILPSLVALGKKFGEKSIDVVTTSSLASLFLHNPYIRKLYLTEKVSTKELFFLLPRFRKERYEALLLYRHTFSNALLSLFTGIPKRAGLNWKGAGSFLTHRVPYDPELNERERYLKIVSQLLGKKVTYPEKILFFTRKEKQEAKHMRRKLLPTEALPVGIYPGSSPAFPVKRWPAEKYVLFCRALKKKYPEVGFIIFSGKEKEERDLAEMIKSKVGSSAIVAPGEREDKALDLRKLALFFSQLALYVGNDTGPTHLAAATGIPVVVLNGPKRKEKVAPFGKNVLVVEHEVFCRPCKRKRCLHHICLEHLEVEEVVSAAERLLIPLKKRKNYS